VTPNQIRELCAAGRRVDWDDIETRLIEAHRRNTIIVKANRGQERLDVDTRGEHADGWPAGTMGGGGGGGPTILVEDEAVPVTAIEAAVFARMDPRIADPLHHHVGVACNSIRVAVHLARDTVATLNRIDRISDPNPSANRGIAICAEPPCEAPAAPGRRGRCEADYRWLLRWEETNPGAQAPPVPAVVIERRTQRRAHITGPLVPPPLTPVVQPPPE
jgi:hypothetical protein